jgi:outer membrane usher protein FimD/PapC
VAEVAGNLLTDDDEFDVVVNGQRQGKVSRGARGIISLTPYRTYRVSIEAAEKTGLVDYDAATYEVTLFPGNVVKRVWKVDKVYVLLGTLVDPSGAPIARERVQGAKGYGFTEEDGSFQLEVTGEEPLSVNSKRHKCVFDFTFPESPEYFLDAGEIVCRPVSAEPEGDDQRV